MKEPCMCGATDCRVCGPLQGYAVDQRSSRDRDERDIDDDEIHGVDRYLRNEERERVERERCSP